MLTREAGIVGTSISSSYVDPIHAKFKVDPLLNFLSYISTSEGEEAAAF